MPGAGGRRWVRGQDRVHLRYQVTGHGDDDLFRIGRIFYGIVYQVYHYLVNTVFISKYLQLFIAQNQEPVFTGETHRVTASVNKLG